MCVEKSSLSLITSVKAILSLKVTMGYGAF